MVQATERFLFAVHHAYGRLDRRWPRPSRGSGRPRGGPGGRARSSPVETPDGERRSSRPERDAGGGGLGAGSTERFLIARRPSPSPPAGAGRGALMIGAYVALGLPTAALGVAWTSMRADFDRPLSNLGLLVVTYTVGYLVATADPSVDRGGPVGHRLGAGGGVGAGRGRRLGFALAPSGRWCWSPPAVIGLSGGYVDAALNAQVALHHSSRVMNLMHGGFGVGATLGPLVMTALIGAGISWRWGYAGLAVVQFGLVVGFVRHRGAVALARSGSVVGRTGRRGDRRRLAGRSLGADRPPVGTAAGASGGPPGWARSCSWPTAPPRWPSVPGPSCCSPGGAWHPTAAGVLVTAYWGGAGRRPAGPRRHRHRVGPPWW